MFCTYRFANLLLHMQLKFKLTAKLEYLSKIFINLEVRLDIDLDLDLDLDI